MQKRHISFLLLYFAKIFFLTKLSTFYLEPGSSSFLLKMLISSLIGFVVFFRQIWSYVRAMLSKVSGQQKKPIIKNDDLIEQQSQNEIQ
jgi:hypothetical protein